MKRETKRETRIYRVRFKKPPTEGDDRQEFFFSSLAAIYDTFTPEQVGCGMARLYNARVSKGQPYTGRLCEITREEVKSKAQKRPVNGSSE